LKILFVSPIPPLITGHSLVSKCLLDFLNHQDEVKIVTLSKDSIEEGLLDNVKKANYSNQLARLYFSSFAFREKHWPD